MILMVRNRESFTAEEMEQLLEFLRAAQRKLPSEAAFQREKERSRNRKRKTHTTEQPAEQVA